MKNAFVSVGILLALAAPALAQPQSQLRANNNPSAASLPSQIDVDSYKLDITVIPEERKIEGKADITLRQLERNAVATFDLDKHFKVTKLTIGDVSPRFRQFEYDSTLEVDLGNGSTAADGTTTLHVEYYGLFDSADDLRSPVLNHLTSDSAYFLYEGRWYPTNGLYKDKATMQLSVHAPAGWTVVADVPPSGSGFASNVPSYWGTLALGKYSAMTVKSGDNEITVYTLKAPSQSILPLAVAAGKILDFYGSKFGPLASNQFHIIEAADANWTSRWSMGSLLLPTSQFRSDVDVPAFARTIARQWFPLKLSVADPVNDAWLSDGMSVFASLLYGEKNLSPAEFDDQVGKVLVKALAYEGSMTMRQAGGTDKDSLEYHSLVENKGAYVFRMLQWLMGNEKFDTLMTRYVDQFKDKPVSASAFTKLASDVYGDDLAYFFDQWVSSSGVPQLDASYQVLRVKDGYSIVGQIKQDLDLFRMPVELVIQTDDEPEYKRVDVVGPKSDFSVNVARKPKPGGILIDPRKKILRMSQDIRVSVFINRGEESAAEMRYNDAVDSYQQALELDGNSSLASFRMAEARFESGDINTAVQLFRDALNGDLKPKWLEVWAHINIGKIYDLRGGQRDRAVQEYQKALNTGDDSYGAQAAAKEYLMTPFRQAPAN
jgi:aminopeptidase N